MKQLSKITFLLLIATMLFSATANSQEWTTTSSSQVGGRFGHTSTMLNDGRIIVIGGHLSLAGDLLKKVEIFDPIADTWTEVAEMLIGIRYTTSVCVSDSTVLVFGGEIVVNSDLQTTDDVYEYNINTDTWTKVADMPIDITNHTATVLNNNKVLIFGGERISGVLNPWAFVYDPATRTFGENININEPRSMHYAIRLNNGKVLIGGGYGQYFWYSCELYNPQTNTISFTDDMPTDGTGKAVVKTNQGNIVVAGGYNGSYLNDIHIFNAQSETWSSFPDLPVERTRPNLAIMQDGNIMCASGFHNTKGTYLNDVISIDPETGSQTSLDNLSEPRSNAMTYTLPDNRILLLQGQTETTAKTYHSNGIIYGPATDPLSYNVTFHITETDGTTPINEASITFNDETLLTNPAGEITFTEIATGNGLPFFVEKDGFGTYAGSASVLNNDIDIYVSIGGSNENDITYLYIAGQIGDSQFNNTSHTVTVDMSAGTDVTALAPNILVSEGATINPPSGTTGNFTNPVIYTVTAENGDEQAWTVTVNLLTDINNISENSFKIYPNPSTGIFTIQNLQASARPCSVSITNITGKIIYKQQSVIRNSQFVINKKGIYFINIVYAERSRSKTETDFYSEKLIIQ